MGRNVIIKHTNNPTAVNYNAFIKDLPKGLTERQKMDLAKGILMVCNRENKEALYVVNTAGSVIPIAMTCEGDLPPNVEAAIAEAISSLSQEMHEYVDDTVGERIDENISEYNAIVVESGTNLYNTFEKKVTKNGDYIEEPMLNYTFENKLYDDLGNIAVTQEQFLSNFRTKHPDTELSDEEIKTMYHEYIDLGPNDTVSVKVSELLRLVEKVNELELRIETLEGRE